jgi:hypothetical protein
MLKLRCAWIWRVDNAVAWIQGASWCDTTSNGDGGMPEPKPEQLDTAPVDWHVVLRSGGRCRPRRRAAVQSGGRLAEVNDDLERAARLLTVELADLKVTLAEVRLAFATDRTHALELPNPLAKRADLN